MNQIEAGLETPDGPDVNAHEAWAGEIARRIARLYDGTARTVTAAEALSLARARLAARRA